MGGETEQCSSRPLQTGHVLGRQVVGAGVDARTGQEQTSTPGTACSGASSRAPADAPTLEAGGEQRRETGRAWDGDGFLTGEVMEEKSLQAREYDYQGPPKPGAGSRQAATAGWAAKVKGLASGKWRTANRVILLAAALEHHLILLQPLHVRKTRPALMPWDRLSAWGTNSYSLCQHTSPRDTYTT